MIPYSLTLLLHKIKEYNLSCESEAGGMWTTWCQFYQRLITEVNKKSEYIVEDRDTWFELWLWHIPLHPDMINAE